MAGKNPVCLISCESQHETPGLRGLNAEARLSLWQTPGEREATVEKASETAAILSTSAKSFT